MQLSLAIHFGLVDTKVIL